MDFTSLPRIVCCLFADSITTEQDLLSHIPNWLEATYFPRLSVSAQDLRNRASAQYFIDRTSSSFYHATPPPSSSDDGLSDHAMEDNQSGPSINPGTRPFLCIASDLSDMSSVSRHQSRFLLSSDSSHYSTMSDVSSNNSDRSAIKPISVSRVVEVDDFGDDSEVSESDSESESESGDEEGEVAEVAKGKGKGKAVEEDEENDTSDEHGDDGDQVASDNDYEGRSEDNKSEVLGQSMDFSKYRVRLCFINQFNLCSQLRLLLISVIDAKNHTMKAILKTFIQKTVTFIWHAANFSRTALEWSFVRFARNLESAAPILTIACLQSFGDILNVSATPLEHLSFCQRDTA